MNPTNPPGRGSSTKRRLLDGLGRYLLISAYLYVCFGAILLYKAAILDELGQHYLPLGVAAAKALILGKFVMIGEMAGARTRFGSSALLPRVALRSMLLLLVLIVLTVLEHLLVGVLHGASLGKAVSGLMELLRPEMLASMLLMLLILVPLVTVTEVGRALGPDGLRRLLGR